MSETNQEAEPKPSWKDKVVQRNSSGRPTSLGTKLIYVLITGFLSLIPLLTVSGVLAMRNDYATKVIRGLEDELGGQQRVFGPVIVVPTKWKDPTRIQTDGNGTQISVQKPPPPDVYFMPEELGMTAELSTRQFKESVYEVIGYESAVDFEADFGTLSEGFPYVEGTEYVWEEAWLVLYLTNTASTKFRPELEVEGTSIPLYAGLSAGNVLFDNMRRSSRLTEKSLYQPPTQSQGYSAKIGSLLDPEKALSVKTKIAFNGATALAIAPVGRDMALTIKSERTPSLIRNFSADIDAIGQGEEDGAFSNVWNTAGPYRSGKVSDVRRDTNSSLLAKQDFVVEFDPGNIRPYADIARALRYGFFLMGFSFLTFFILEALSQKYLHTAQYFLLGLIQSVFYALLLGVAEFTGFDVGFLLCAVPTVVVTGFAVGSILRSAGHGGIALVIFGAFYAVQYILMDMAQFSLLVAAGATFIALAAALLATSRMDWSRFSKTDEEQASG